MSSKSNRQIRAEEIAVKDGHKWENLNEIMQNAYLHNADTSFEAEARDEVERQAKAGIQVELPNASVDALDPYSTTQEAERARIRAIANAENTIPPESDLEDSNIEGAAEYGSTTGAGEDNQSAGSGLACTEDKPKKPAKRKRSGKKSK